MRSAKGHQCASPVEFNARQISVGDLQASIVDGAMRQLRFAGIEVVRGLDCPIRDVNWGTAVPDGVTEEFKETSDTFVYLRQFTVFDGALSADLEIEFHSTRVVATVSLHACRRVETNRAGFTLLHPVNGVADTELTIRHADGNEEGSRFPAAISPGQPAFDIVGLRHVVQGVAVDIRFSGEVFEMEDQRNWTDASYKTYCRPLGLGFPYSIEAGETVRQKIDILLSDAVSTTPAKPAESGARGALPDVAVALDPDWQSATMDATLARLPTARRILRVDTAKAVPPFFLDAIDGPVELEVLVDDDGDMVGGLHALADKLTENRISVDGVTVLPRAFLQSYQPTGDWPTGHGIADAAACAKAVFPNSPIGVGMLTNFTEFNRHPPPRDIGDFTTYSTTAIVHAGDDLSVFETLEALPHVHRSARALSGDRQIRLGLASIGMRSNPYGADVADNPRMERIAMAMHDPRQQTVFGAAFAVGAFAAAARSGCAQIALAGAGGPFAFGQVQVGAFHAWPIYHVVQMLSALSGSEAAALPSLPNSVVGVKGHVTGKFPAVLANCSVASERLMLPGQRGAIMDGGTDASAPDWLERAEVRALDDVVLPPAAVVFIMKGADE